MRNNELRMTEKINAISEWLNGMLLLVYEVFYFIGALVFCTLFLQLISITEGFGCDEKNLFSHSSANFTKGHTEESPKDTFHFTKDLVIEIPPMLTDIPRAVVYQVIDKLKLLGGLPVVGNEKFQVPGANTIQRLRWKFSHVSFKSFESGTKAPDRCAVERSYDVKILQKLGSPKARTLISQLIKFLPFLP